MTGRGLLRKLRRDPFLDEKFRHPSVVPLLARLVMEASCDLVARSGDSEFRLDAQLSEVCSLASVVARQMDVVCSPEEVRDCLARLARCGFLVLDEDGLGMRLPLPEEPDLESDGGCPDDPDSDWMDGDRS